RVATGGRGSGKAHLQSQGSVVVMDRWILVVNAGSDDVSVIATDGLGLVDRIASGGSTPTSIAAYGSRVYVLNAGADANIIGFRIGADGRLVRVADATHSVGESSDPAQVAFSPDGRTLVVTDRASDSIHVFALDAEGRVDEHTTHASRGATPYGFDFRPDGTL